MLLSSLGASIANVGLPALAQAFGASFQQVQWIVLAYLLAVTGASVGAGRLGDIAGRRRLLVAGIALFSLASLLCGLAPGFGLLVTARVLQGLGAAVMMSLTLAMAGTLAVQGRTGRIMGLLGTMSAVGTALGPVLGGLLLGWGGWQALFLAKVPLGVLALLLALRWLPADNAAARAGRHAFDSAGTLMLVLALLAYALAMTLGRGRFGPLNLALLALAMLGAWLFVRVEKRVPHPLLHLSMLRDPVLGAGLAANMLVATVMMTSQVVGPFYLSMPLALDAARVGIAMACGPAAAALGGVPAGRAVDRFGPGRVASAGLAVMVAGCALLAGLPAGLGVAGYVAPMAVLTLGYALFQAANNSAVMAGAGAERRGVVSGMLSLARNLGFMTGAAVMGAVFAWGVGSGDLAQAQPQAVAAGMRAGFAAAAALGGIAFAIQWRAAARVRLSGVNAGRDPGSGTWRAVFLRRRRRPRAGTP
jgi:MFS family permease